MTVRELREVMENGWFKIFDFTPPTDSHDILIYDERRDSNSIPEEIANREVLDVSCFVNPSNDTVTVEVRLKQDTRKLLNAVKLIGDTCNEMDSCNNCLFNTKLGGCILRQKHPCDWMDTIKNLEER